MNVNWKREDGRVLKQQAPTRRLDRIGALRRGLRWSVGISPGPTRILKKSVLFLLSATHRRSNLNAGCQPLVAAGHAQASATSPSFVLIILWITSFLVLARIVSTSGFRVKKKMKQKHN
jgi:hypothetical protein